MPLSFLYLVNDYKGNVTSCKSVATIFSKETYLPHSCPNHAALCCFKLLKLSREEALNCLKGQRQKRSIAQPSTTARLRFQIWPSYHPKAGAVRRSTGGSPVLPSIAAGVSSSELGAPLPSPKVLLKAEPRWRGAGEVGRGGSLLSSWGNRVSPGRLPQQNPTGPGNRRSTGLRAAPLPRGPIV